MLACASVGFSFVLVGVGIVLFGVYIVKKLIKQEKNNNA